MTTRSLLRTLAIGAALALAPFVATLVRADQPVPDQVLVELTPGTPPAPFAADYGCVIVDGVPAWNVWLLQTAPGADTAALALQMKFDPRVLESEQHERFEMAEGVQRTMGCLDRTATPITFTGQPAAQTIGTQAAQLVQRGAHVIVAVLDTGMALHNAETRDRLLVLPGANFAGGGALPDMQPDGVDNDGDGLVDEGLNHGTLVAGAVHLAAPDALLLPVRVLDEEGRGTDFAAVNGILFALDHGARVINLSFAMTTRSNILRRAIDQAVARGSVVVAAAGNRGQNGLDFPAEFSSAIAVAAVDDDRMPTLWTNYASNVALSAPGVHVTSTWDDGSGYGWWDGTSFAAPTVSGGAALLLERYPGLTPAQVRSFLSSTAQPIVAHGEQAGKMGAGELDLAALVNVQTTDRTSLDVDPVPSPGTVHHSPIQGATVYDIARGDVRNLHAEQGGGISLGPLACIANDAPQSTVADAAVPAPGAAFFYVFRDDAPDAGGHSYGTSNDGRPRSATGGDCPL